MLLAVMVLGTSSLWHKFGSHGAKWCFY